MSSNGDAFAVELRAAARHASPADSALAGDSAVTRFSEVTVVENRTRLGGAVAPGLDVGSDQCAAAEIRR